MCGEARRIVCVPDAFGFNLSCKFVSTFTSAWPTRPEGNSCGAEQSSTGLVVVVLRKCTESGDRNATILKHNITKLPWGNEVLMAFIIITCGEAVLSIWTEPKKETLHHHEVQLFIHPASTTFPFMDGTGTYPSCFWVMGDSTLE